MRSISVLAVFLPLILASNSLFGARQDGFALKAAFEDACTRWQVSFTNPNGTWLSLDFEGVGKDGAIKDAKATWVDLYWTMPESSFSLHQRYDWAPDESEHHLKLPKGRALSELMKRNPGTRVLEVRAQGGVRLASGEEVLRETTARILLAPAQFEYYEKTSEPICRLASGVAIRSEYRFNSGPGPLEIKRRIFQDCETGAGRVFLPVIYSGKSLDSYFRRGMELEREWELNPQQGGVFADRVHYSRYRANHRVWKERAAGSCGAYVKASEGWLDEGEVVTDFFVVPGSAVTDPARTQDYLNAFLPAPAPCPEGDSVADVRIRNSFPTETEFNFTESQPEGAPR